MMRGFGWSVEVIENYRRHGREQASLSERWGAVQGVEQMCAMWNIWVALGMLQFHRLETSRESSQWEATGSRSAW